jgi:hypothetical protein
MTALQIAQRAQQAAQITAFNISRAAILKSSRQNQRGSSRAYARP